MPTSKTSASTSKPAALAATSSSKSGPQDQSAKASLLEDARRSMQDIAEKTVRRAVLNAAAPLQPRPNNVRVIVGAPLRNAAPSSSAAAGPSAKPKNAQPTAGPSNQTQEVRPTSGFGSGGFAAPMPSTSRPSAFGYAQQNTFAFGKSSCQCIISFYLTWIIISGPTSPPVVTNDRTANMHSTNAGMSTVFHIL